MIIDPRITPTGDAVAKAPGLKDNPSLRSLTIDQFGMEVANEIGVDPNNLAAFGLTAQKIDQYEAQLHSGTQNGNNG